MAGWERQCSVLDTLVQLSFVAFSAPVLHVVAPFVGVVAKQVGVPCLQGLLDFGAVLHVMGSETFLTGEGRRMFNVEIRVLSSLIEF